MLADWFTLIPAGMTLIKMGRQARWHSMILQMCDGSSIPVGISPLCPALTCFQVLQPSRASLPQGLVFPGLPVSLWDWPEVMKSWCDLISIPASIRKSNSIHVRPMLVSRELARVFYWRMTVIHCPLNSDLGTKQIFPIWFQPKWCILSWKANILLLKWFAFNNEPFATGGYIPYFGALDSCRGSSNQTTGSILAWTRPSQPLPC